jgi:hypothetical protein
MKLLCSCAWSDSVRRRVRRCLLLVLSVGVVTKGCQFWLCFFWGAWIESALEMHSAIEGDDECSTEYRRRLHDAVGRVS